MAIIVVGRKGDKRKVRWFVLIGIGAVGAAIGGLVEFGRFYLLYGRWSHLPVIIGGLFGAIFMMGMGLICGLGTPIDKLKELK